MASPEILEKKKKVVEAIKKEIEERGTGLFFIDFKGLKVVEEWELRKEARNLESRYWVVKNTLLRRALKEAGHEVPDEVFKNATGVIFTPEPVKIAKFLVEFLKDKKDVKVKGIIFEGKFYDGKSLKTISRMPTKEDILAQLVYTLAGPLHELVRCLEYLPASVVYAMENLKEEKENKG